jgi:hypothetical protein
MTTFSSSCVVSIDLRSPRYFITYAAIFIAPFYGCRRWPVQMLITDYVNEMCAETPTDLWMGVPVHVTNFVGLRVTLNEPQRRARNYRYLRLTSPDKMRVIGLKTD